MKRTLLFICLFQLFVLYSLAQSTAPNWNHADCNLINHTLYDYLDSQEVVVMEFVMGCSSCTDAGTHLMNLKNQYDVSHPGKVNFFLMDYYPSNTCVDVNSTWASYNYNAYFAGCWAEKEVYYPTLYPMPAVVIAAGNYHTAIFQTIGWLDADTTLIKQSIDQFFNTVGIEGQTDNQSFLLYPNPVNEVLNVNLSGISTSALNIAIYDIVGKKENVNSFRIDKNILAISVTHLAKGNYILELTSQTNIIRKVFVKS